ncbi:MAG: hypothetical protein RLZZ502_943, partial [Pseudomonadota bacterium]
MSRACRCCANFYTTNMALLSLTDACLAYGHHPLLDHAQFSLQTGERIALIGRNGAGKSSLMRVLIGERRLDDGLLQTQKDCRVAYVPQEPVLDPDHHIHTAVQSALHAETALLARFADLTSGGQTSNLEELAQVQSACDNLDAWQIEQRVANTLTALNLNAELKISDLSGGQRKRVALAQAWVQAPQVLLLDEPTNHLDIDGITWLEQTLLQFKGAICFITHDRRMMNAVATRIVELERGVLRSYPGNFEQYQLQKAQQLAVEAVENAKADKLLSQEEQWIRQGVEARRTRSVARIARLEQLRKDRLERRNQVGQVNMQLDRGEKSGKRIAEFTDLAYAYPGQSTLIEGLSGLIQRGDKVGLVAGNGRGKTTLIKLILGQITPTHGNIKLGSNISVAYFDQLRNQLDDHKTVADTISPGSEWIEIGNSRKHVMSYLSDFLFDAARAMSPVSSLSGGERNRLLLARLFARPAN